MAEEATTSTLDTASHAVLRVEHISKTFAGTRALRDVSLSFRRGEVHALLGNNGSGKSTLIKILAGVYNADAEPRGTLHIGARSFDAHHFSPTLARSLGLHFVHQNPALFPMLSVAENLALGRGFEVAHGAHGAQRAHGEGESPWARIDWPKQRARAARLIERFQIHATPDLPAFMLEPADRTLVAIARALQDQDGVHAGVLILDEPTASLAAPEVERLLQTLRDYARAGQTIIYVSHRLNEVLGACDRVSALRDGQHVGTADVEGLDEAKLVSMMLGRSLEATRLEKRTSTRAASGEAKPETPLLSARGLRGKQVRGFDFEVARGEVLGLAGLLGSGASSVLRLLFGADARSGGELRMNGAAYSPGTPAEAIARGIAYVPPDRALESSFHALSVRANLSAVQIGRYFQGLRLRHDREARDTAAALERFMIRAASDAQGLSTLSGGNQQKVILARWLQGQPQLLLLDEPTQGVAAHARREIHGLLRQAARAGTSLVVVSSDFEELVQLCDRVLVVAHGQNIGEVSGERLDSQRLTALAHFAPETSHEQ